VEGSLQTRKWQDQQGQDRYTTEIKASRIQFLDRRGEDAGTDYGDSLPKAKSGKAPKVSNDVGDFEAAFGDGFPTDASEMDKMPF